MTTHEITVNIPNYGPCPVNVSVSLERYDIEGARFGGYVPEITTLAVFYPEAMEFDPPRVLYTADTAPIDVLELIEQELNQVIKGEP